MKARTRKTSTLCFIVALISLTLIGLIEIPIVNADATSLEEGFENWNQNNWGIFTTGSGSVTITTDAKYSGTYGCSFYEPETGYGLSNIYMPTSGYGDENKTIVVSFRYKLSSGTITSANHWIAEYASTQIGIKNIGGTVYFELRMFDNGLGWIYGVTDVECEAGVWYLIKFVIRSVPSPNGFVYLYINDVLEYSNTEVNFPFLDDPPYSVVIGKPSGEIGQNAVTYYYDDVSIHGGFLITSVVITNRSCLDSDYDENSGTGWLIAESIKYDFRVTGTYVDDVPDTLAVRFLDEQENIAAFWSKAVTNTSGTWAETRDFIVASDTSFVYADGAFTLDVKVFLKRNLVDTWYCDLEAWANDTAGNVFNWAVMQTDYFNIYSRGGLATEYFSSGIIGTHALSEDLVPDAWVLVHNDWTHSGTEPWINSSDGDSSYMFISVESDNLGKYDEHWTFGNLTYYSQYAILGVRLYITGRISGRAEGADARPYIHNGSSWHYGDAYFSSSSYTEVMVVDLTNILNTPEKINNAKMKIEFSAFNGAEGGTLLITSARLRVEGYGYTSSSSGRMQSGDLFNLYAFNNSYASAAMAWRYLVHTKARYELMWTFPSQEGEFSWDETSHELTGGVFPRPIWRFGLGYYVNGEWVPAGMYLEIQLQSFVWGVNSPGAIYANYSTRVFRNSGGMYDETLYSGYFIAFVYAEAKVEGWSLWDRFLRFWGFGFLLEDPYPTNGTATSKIWVDMWFNKANASSIFGIRVGAFEYAMDNEAPWYLRYLTGNNWGVLDKEKAECLLFIQQIDAGGDVFYYKDVEMMVPYVVATQYTSECNEIGAISEVGEFSMFYSTEGGIDTPKFEEPKIPALPRGGIIGLIAMLGAEIWMFVGPIFQYIWSGIAWLLDEALYLLTGQQGLFTAFVNVIVALLGGILSFMVIIATVFINLVSVLVSIVTAFFTYVFDAIWGFFNFVLFEPSFNVLATITTIFGIMFAWLGGTSYTNAFGQVYDFTYLSSMTMGPFSGGIVIFIVVFIIGFFLTILRCFTTMSLAPILEPISIFWAFIQFIITVIETMLSAIHKIAQLLIQAVHAIRDMVPKIFGTG